MVHDLEHEWGRRGSACRPVSRRGRDDVLRPDVRVLSGQCFRDGLRSHRVAATHDVASSLASTQHGPRAVRPCGGTAPSRHPIDACGPERVGCREHGGRARVVLRFVQNVPLEGPARCMLHRVVQYRGACHRGWNREAAVVSRFDTSFRNRARAFCGDSPEQARRAVATVHASDRPRQSRGRVSTPSRASGSGVRGEGGSGFVSDRGIRAVPASPAPRLHPSADRRRGSRHARSPLPVPSHCRPVVVHRRRCGGRGARASGPAGGDSPHRKVGRETWNVSTRSRNGGCESGRR